MANAKDIQSGAGNILIIGDGGTWKTRFLTSIPGVYVFDFDKGMASVKGQDVEYDTYKDLARDIKGGPDFEKIGLYEFGKSWDAFYKKFQDVMQKVIARDPKAPKCIALDSLTMMSFSAVNKILLDTGHAAPHQGTWGAHHEYFKTIFSMATALPIRFVCTAHIQRDENQITQTTEKLPLLAGKLAGLVPVFFDEVWYTEAKGDGIVIRTKQSATLKQAKSRDNIKDETPLTWKDIAPLIGEKTVLKMG